MLSTTTYRRKPVDLDVIRVTEANMAEVAGWANGEIKATDEGRLYISIDVVKPGNDRQTQAFAGDWVIFSPQGGGFKIYMDRPFQQNFEQVDAEMNFVNVTPRPYVKPKVEAEKPKPGPAMTKESVRPVPTATGDASGGDVRALDAEGAGTPA